MNVLLHAKQGALQQARARPAGRARGEPGRRAPRSRRRSAGSRPQQAAAERAAALAAQQQQQQHRRQRIGSGGPAPAGPTLGPSGGWAIPYAIVLCESGGQNLTPNSAGASGYYQIMPATWKLFGGTGPAAYLASKAEQDAVASRIWNGGAGASNWVCAGIVGIH